MAATKGKKKAGVDTTKGIKDPIEVVFRQGILFKIDSHCWWGKSSKVDESEINAPKEILSGVKTLVNPNTLSSLQFYKGFGERSLKKRGYPFLGLRGVYYIPKDFIGSIEMELRETKKAFDKEVDEYIQNYPKYKSEWKKKSGTYYNEALYPSKEQLQNKFRFDYTKFVITVPDPSMGILNEDEYREELDKQKVKMREFLDGTLTELASKFYVIIDRLATKIESGDTVKPKSLESLRSFVETFESMNVTGNKKLSELVSKAQNYVGATGARDLNQDDKLRKSIGGKISKLVDQFQKHSEKDTRFKRAIEF